MIRGLRYYSFVEPTGYGLAAIAYVRALVNAGVAVHWVPIVRHGDGVRPLEPGDAMPMSMLSAADAALADLPALLAATSAPIAVDTIVAHTVPEHWTDLFEPHRRNIGYTAWETDRIPAHWRTLLDLADLVLVPCTMNRDSFVAGGIRRIPRVVPHVRRHVWNAFTPREIEAARARFGIDASRFVFYSINTWDPRKALPALLDAFVRAFRDEDGVALVLKTAPIGSGPPPFHHVGPTLPMAQLAVDAATDELDRDAPPVCLLPSELDGRDIDLIHESGDACVSLTHGEAWGLGLFDAATRGTPAIATGWGGQLDYFGADWPGALAFRMTRVPVWPPFEPSYWPSQRWATPDRDAAIAAMRALADDPGPARAAAAAIAERIANRYAEPVVAREFIEAIG